jgi:hypothetical protein
MDDFKIEKWTLDDGRRAERRVTENTSDNGQSERVVELHVEDERPLRLQQRVVEKSKPIVYERKVETLDPKTGSVVEQRVESIEPKVQMQLVEHIASASTVAAQSVEDDCDCHVTKDEMIDTIVATIKATRETAPVREVVREVPAPAVRMQAMPTPGGLAGRLNSLGLADEIAGRVDPAGMSTMDKVLLGVIAAQIVGLGYIIFFM